MACYTLYPEVPPCVAPSQLEMLERCLKTGFISTLEHAMLKYEIKIGNRIEITDSIHGRQINIIIPEFKAGDGDSRTQNKMGTPKKQAPAKNSPQPNQHSKKAHQKLEDVIQSNEKLTERFYKDSQDIEAMKKTIRLLVEENDAMRAERIDMQKEITELHTRNRELNIRLDGYSRAARVINQAIAVVKATSDEMDRQEIDKLHIRDLDQNQYGISNMMALPHGENKASE